VEAGHIECWRCGYAIAPDEPWDLGHDDEDRTRYRGPEHVACNRSAGAVKGNVSRALPRCWCGGSCRVHVLVGDI
jgi:hypothetical protein